VDRAVGLSDRELSVGGEFEPPAEFVDEVVMAACVVQRVVLICVFVVRVPD
jgi:hypothetical protein